MGSGEGSTVRRLYRLPNKVRVIKYRRLSWAGHVARMEEGRNLFNILTGKPTETECLGVDGMTILEWVLNKYASIRGMGCFGEV